MGIRVWINLVNGDCITTGEYEPKDIEKFIKNGDWIVLHNWQREWYSNDGEFNQMQFSEKDNEVLRINPANIVSFRG